MIEDLFNPTEQHASLRKNVAEFTRREIEPQAKHHDRTETFNTDLFKKAAEVGYLGVTIPQKFGGAGMDTVSAVILYEEMSRSDPAFAMSCLAHSILFGHNLAENGSESQKLEYLPKIASGDSRAGIAITTPEGGTDVLAMRNTARRNGNYWILNGTKTFITNFDGNLFLVYARTGQERDNVSLFVVESNYDGFLAGKKEQDKMGMRASPTGDITFQDCKVPLEMIVGDVNHAVDAMKKNLEIERLTLAAISAGIALRCIDEMTNYANERKSFEKTIINYGQIKSMLANSYSEMQAARTHLYWAALNADLKLGKLHDADAVKLNAANVGTRVSDNAIQVLGGFGYCAHAVQRLYRDARLIRIGGGTDEAMENNIAKAFTKK